MRNLFKKIKKQNSFKKRNMITPLKLQKFNLQYSYIYIKNQIIFEPVYFEIFRKKLKNYLKFKQHPYKINYLWINLNLNFPISRKSKNARMGKGVGGFNR